MLPRRILVIDSLMLAREPDQMKIIKLACMCVGAALLASGQGHSKGWRGITPLHSTCEDVKRTLNVGSCESPVFTLENEIANIDFSDKPCADGWNVPPGTVISITVYPKKKPQFADLLINMDEYKKVVPPHQPDWSIYLNAEEGISIAVTPDGRVEYFTYGPSAKDEHLRYPNSLADQPTTRGDSHSVLKFDEYSDLTLSEEHKRLDSFALQLRDEPNTQGYIIAYAGRCAYAGEAQARAERAKNYLVNRRGIESGRITTADGGYREELTVELFVNVKGGAAPTPSPTVCPSEAQIVKGGSARDRRHPTRPRCKQ